MSSGTDAAAARRAAALDGLRFHKTQTTAGPSLAAPSMSSTSSYAAAYSPPLPPPQSRDATVASTSRFWPSTPSFPGKVLVPSSSPLASDVYNRPHQPTYPLNGHDVAPLPAAPPANPWASRPGASHSYDSLAASSGFIPQNGVSHASLTRPSIGNGRGMSEGARSAEDGSSRKRGRVPEPAPDPFAVPPSPDVVRPGQRRRTNLLSHSPSSSEDSFPDSVSGTNGRRIVRGRPGAPDPQTSEQSASEADDERFRRFKLTMPLYEPKHIKAAWDEVDGDVKKATDLLQDPSWVPKPMTTPTTSPPTKEVTGRVKEIDEATKLERAAVRARGKQSSIYQNRVIIEPKPALTPVKVPATRQLPVTLMSPSSPVIAAPRRKAAKRIVDSDSEPEYEESDDEKGGRYRGSSDESSDERRALHYFNTASKDALQELTGCTAEQSNAIVDLRPFDTVDDLKAKLGQGRKKTGPAGIGPRLFDDCTVIFAGYGAVDSVLADCERIGGVLRAAIASWTAPAANGKGKAKEDPTTADMGLPQDEVEDGALSLTALPVAVASTSKDFLLTQPKLVSDEIQLKDYQLTGVSWLRLLYRKRLSCILADEMGLGKTAQVISFFASLKEQGNKGPHLIVVPSSTLENWCREFERFAPSITIRTYYGNKNERPMLRQSLNETQLTQVKDGWEVLITTYNLAQGDEKDRKFFRRVEWDTCVFDEGHVLKNFQSQRYHALLKYESKWRLLLTGTPLQNNLQELVSLMNFILPDQFAESMESLRAIFKVKGDSKVSLLAQERVSRAKKMMTPFVLRRRKDQVLKDLPKKVERIEWCEMSSLQKTIYRDALQRSRKTIMEAEAALATAAGEDAAAATTGRKSAPKKKKPPPKAKEKVYAENSANVLMDLRKAALHPMLFRNLFTNDVLTGITKLLLKEPDFRKRGAIFDHVKEDMEVMTDAELQVFVATYKSTRKYLQKDDCYLEAGKIVTLLRLMKDYQEQGRKMLIFSQFTQALDILQAILKLQDVRYLLLTGTTAVDVRQALVDEFTEDDSIPIFLLSTKAGGMGINLTAASVVIMFDQDFNPHNDRQAQDRAYRIGQKRDVEVIKLIMRNTIEEDMLRLGETKLALDEAVAGDTEEGGPAVEGIAEKQMKTSLMSVLRKQFEQDEGKGGATDKDGDVEMTAADGST